MGASEAFDWRCFAQEQGHGTGSILDPYEDFILDLIEENKDITLDEMSEALERFRF